MVPRPGRSTMSARNRRRVHSRTISSLIVKTSRSATDLERPTKQQTAPTMKLSAISVIKKGHLKAVCQKKQRQEQGSSSHNPMKRITKADLVQAILGEFSQDTPRLDVPVTIQDRHFTMELDTATMGNFVSLPVWKQLGKPKLDDVRHRYESASKHNLPVRGTFMAQTKDPVTGKQSSVPYIVTKIPDLNLLGRNTIQTLGISVDNA